MRITRNGSLVAALLTPIVAALFMAACDTMPAVDPETAAELVEAARSWHHEQLAQNPDAAKFGNPGPDASVLLNRFFPDWDLAEVVSSPDGRQAVVATLGPDARARFDTTRSIVRTIVITLDEHKKVYLGEIVEFVSPDEQGLQDVRALVAGYLAGEFGASHILVARYNIKYKPIGATVYAPSKPSVDVKLKIRECLKAGGPGKMKETQYCIVTDEITYAVCVGDNECTWNTDVYLTCWDIDEDEGSQGGGGDWSDGSGGGGGDGASDGIGDVARKSDIQAIFAACNVTNSQTQESAFENSIRKAMGMLHRSEKEGGQLDGYTKGDYFGQLLINSIMEAKFKESWPTFSYSQSSGHLYELNSIYNYAPSNSITMLSPVYFTVSLYDGGNPNLDYEGKVIALAEQLGVSIVNLTVREAGFGKFILYGKVITDWQLLRWGDLSLTLPSWLSNGSFASLPFSFDCDTD